MTQSVDHRYVQLRRTTTGRMSVLPIVMTRDILAKRGHLMTDVVDTFRRITGLLLRWLAYALLAIVGLCLVVWAAVAGHEWYSYDRHAENVVIDISTDRADCADDKYPIRVRILNGSGKTLERTTFTLAARFKDRSTDIARYTSLVDDHINAPNNGYSNCWSVPPLSEPVADARVLNWSIASKRFVFRD